MRVLSGVFALVFLLAVAVQWNDPDPLSWMVGYGVAAALSLTAAFGRVPVLPNALASLGFMLWCLRLVDSLPGAPAEAFTSFTMREASHEEPREAIGLLLAASWTAFLAWRGTRAQRSASS